jgi:hypothetical protein
VNRERGNPSLLRFLSWPDARQAAFLIRLMDRGQWDEFFTYSANNR